MVKELLTREDFYGAIRGGEGMIVIVDNAGSRTAHPLACDHVQGEHFVEKVIEGDRKNGRYYLAGSFPEARRELDAQPCQG